MDTNTAPEANEPPNELETSTTASDETVQPTHGPNVDPEKPDSPPEPAVYDGPTDKDSVIDAVIRGALTTAEAAALLNTSTGSIRKLKSRETARRDSAVNTGPKSPRHATASLSHIVSPPYEEQPDAAQIVDVEGVNPETSGETITREQALQLLQPSTETGTETGRDSQTGGETEGRDISQEASETLQVRVGRANLQKANRERAERAAQKSKDDEGSFERDELDTLDNLHRIITRNAKRAESGKDCQGWTASLAIVLDLRRRAAGKSCTLVKEQTSKALGARNSIVFIGAQAPAAPKVAKPTPQIIDLPTEPSLSDAPPALKAAMEQAPAYVREL